MSRIKLQSGSIWRRCDEENINNVNDTYNSVWLFCDNKG